MTSEGKMADEFKKNLKLEELLLEINAYLDVISEHEIDSFKKNNEPQYPSLFIVGVPRSGTTLLSQWLAASNEFCYPSNFISRFFRAPFFGAMIQELLFNKDFDYKGELSTSIQRLSFDSDVGKTKGILEPHEFWYFWRRFFSLPDIPISHSAFSKKANFNGFHLDIQRFQQVFKKPFFVKALIMNPYILPLVKSNNKSLIVYIKRNDFANMDSLLRIRKKYFGSEDEWFSFKPKEYFLLKGESNIRQVAGQSFFIKKSIEHQLAEIDESQKWIIGYEDLCKNPERYWGELKSKMLALDYEIKSDFSLPISFNQNEFSNQIINHDFIKALDWVKNIANDKK